MEKRVETFLDESLIDLRDNINDFLKETDGKLHDIKFQTYGSDVFENYIALVIYTPQEGNHEERDEGKEKNKKSYEGIQGRVTSLWQQGRTHCA
jgi:hypothetical protein